MIEGPKNAKILLIGEAWGDAEEKERRPFVGMAGRVLDGLLGEVGLPRTQIAITNVVHERPSGNKFNCYYEKQGGKTVPTPKLVESYERLRNEIVSVNPNVIVPLGAEALKAVMGNRMSILHWRGSVLDSPLGKVIPTIHPAAILRNWQYRPAVVADFERIAKESEYGEIRRRERTLITRPSFESAITELKRLQTVDRIAFDIEVESEQITCISFSDRPDWAICIPFWFGASGSLWSIDEESALWDAIRGLLESESPKKIAHNGSYDVEQLQRMAGIKAKLHFDTMLAFHTLYPELPKNLGYLVSLYTDHPYYKYQIRTSDMEEYFRYNATDSILTFDIATSLERELDERGLKPFYERYVHALVNPLLGMQHRGVNFSTERRNRLRKEYRFKIAGLRTKLEEQVGYPLNVNSHPQMIKWLYTELKLPKKYKMRDTGTKTLSADEEALNEHYQKTKNEALKTILDIREAEKILGTYLDAKIDKDGRIRCSYLITGTETGRLSSRKTAWGTGTNLQNVPAGVVKELFLPDVGKVLVNTDLSQAEARVVAYLASESRLIKVFEGGGDIHKKNAANIYGKKEEEVTQDERNIAKRVVHASNYGMGPRTFAKTAGIAESEAKRLLNQYFATYPRIRYWHMQIKDQLQKSRIMTTPLGRQRIFFNRWGDSVFKEGLAFVPQSTVADLLNQALIELYSKEEELGIELLLQVHDSVVFQLDESRISDILPKIKQIMERPLEVGGRILKIPADFKVGPDWQNMRTLDV